MFKEKVFGLLFVFALTQVLATEPPPLSVSSRRLQRSQNKAFGNGIWELEAESVPVLVLRGLHLSVASC